eukprot:3213449-Rhodomonas_salina.2
MMTALWRAERKWGVQLRKALVWGRERASYWSLAAWSHHRVPTEPYDPSRPTDRPSVPPEQVVPVRVAAIICPSRYLVCLRQPTLSRGLAQCHRQPAAIATGVRNGSKNSSIILHCLAAEEFYTCTSLLWLRQSA